MRWLALHRDDAAGYRLRTGSRADDASSIGKVLQTKWFGCVCVGGALTQSAAVATMPSADGAASALIDLIHGEQFLVPENEGREKHW